MALKMICDHSNFPCLFVYMLDKSTSFLLKFDGILTPYIKKNEKLGTEIIQAQKFINTNYTSNIHSPSRDTLIL